MSVSVLASIHLRAFHTVLGKYSFIALQLSTNPTGHYLQISFFNIDRINHQLLHCATNLLTGLRKKLTRKLDG